MLPVSRVRRRCTCFCPVWLKLFTLGTSNTLMLGLFCDISMYTYFDSGEYTGYSCIVAEHFNTTSIAFYTFLRFELLCCEPFQFVPVCLISFYVKYLRCTLSFRFVRAPGVSGCFSFHRNIGVSYRCFPYVVAGFETGSETVPHINYAMLLGKTCAGPQASGYVF